MYCDVNNLHGWTMSQKLSIDVLEQRKNKFTFDENTMQNYDEDSYNEDKLKFDVKYPKELLTYLSCTLNCYSDREA